METHILSVGDTIIFRRWLLNSHTQKTYTGVVTRLGINGYGEPYYMVKPNGLKVSYVVYENYIIKIIERADNNDNRS